jgi:hypothetical protein
VVTICTAQWSPYVPHCGHYMYRTVVTICTAQWSLYVPHGGNFMNRTVVTIFIARWLLYEPHSGYYMYHLFNICNSTFCPHSVFICFVWISEQTAIISLYSIDWLVFITETECVYCAVRTGSSSLMQLKEPDIKISQSLFSATSLTILTSLSTLYFHNIATRKTNVQSIVTFLKLMLSVPRN